MKEQSMERPRKLRLLRIAISAACLVVGVLLVALWARSFWMIDVASGNRGPHFVYLNTLRGKFHFSRIVTPPGFPIEPWRVRHRQIHDRDLETFESTQQNARRALGFGWKVFGNGWQVTVPLWQPVLLTAVCAIAVWLPWRFSLRTLLIAMTLAGALLAAVVYAAK
jgi:hypothetical protein